MSPSVLPPSPTRTAPSIHTFAIPKTMGLGIILAGGLNREGGPNIYIDRILAGMDAAKVGYLIDSSLCVGKLVISITLAIVPNY